MGQPFRNRAIELSIWEMEAMNALLVASFLPRLKEDKFDKAASADKPAVAMTALIPR